MIISTRKNQVNRGFIGILALLISVAIIMLLMFGSREVPTENVGDKKVEEKSLIEMQLETVDRAKDVKSMLEGKKYDFE